MDKKKVIGNAILLALAIFAFVGCMVGMGFDVFSTYWQHIGDIFKESFFIGMMFLCVPIAFISIMLLILVTAYALLRELNVIKANKFDKIFQIIKLVVFAIAIVSAIFVVIGMFHGL